MRYIVYIEEDEREGSRLRMSSDLQRAMVLHAVDIIEKYAGGLLRMQDDWRVLVAVGMLTEWATDPFYAMLEWTKDDDLWEIAVEPALGQLSDTPFKAQARIAKTAVEWARKQWRLPEENRHAVFTSFVGLPQNNEIAAPEEDGI